MYTQIANTYERATYMQLFHKCLMIIYLTLIYYSYNKWQESPMLLAS